MEDTSAQHAVEQMQRYIHDHMHESISLKQLAQVSGYSMYHASHLFKQVTGLAPFEYIRRQRLVASAYALRKERSVSSTLPLITNSQVMKGIHVHSRKRLVSIPIDLRKFHNPTTG